MVMEAFSSIPLGVSKYIYASLFLLFLKLVTLSKPTSINALRQKFALPRLIPSCVASSR